MSVNSKSIEAALPLFVIPEANQLAAIHEGESVTPKDAVAGLRRALKLGEGDQIERCYVANRPGDEGKGVVAGMVIGSVVREADGFKRDAEIVVNGGNRHDPMGEPAITWFGAVAADYDRTAHVGFMRGELSPIVLQEQISAAS
jgi:hypothetical protein